MKALAIATVSRSLALQSPQQWTILRDLGFEITFAAGEDDYSEVLAGMGTFVPIDLQRSLGSEERRVGKECPSLCRSRWSPYH